MEMTARVFCPQQAGMRFPDSPLLKVREFLPSLRYTAVEHEFISSQTL